MLRNLSRSEPEGAEKWGDREVIDAFSSGNLAMTVTWFSRFPEMISAAEQRNISVGFFPLPGQVTDSGSHRGVTVKMNGIGIMAGGSAERSMHFLTWFYSPRVQLEWAASGHQPGLVPVTDSNEYLSMNLYNRGFPESLRMGVIEMKGEKSAEIRKICEETVSDFISPSPVPQEEQDLSSLDRSAARIDRLVHPSP
jgi:ABC-type glycerol-3-phosphate transport system substrate-binding protein